MTTLFLCELIAMQIVTASTVVASHSLDQEKQAKIAGMLHAIGTIFCFAGIASYFIGFN